MHYICKQGIQSFGYRHNVKLFFRLSPADIQQYTTIRSQDVQPGISTETYFTQSTLTLCQAADPILSVEATETIPEAQCSSYSPKVSSITYWQVSL